MCIARLQPLMTVKCYALKNYVQLRASSLLDYCNLITLCFLSEKPNKKTNYRAKFFVRALFSTHQRIVPSFVMDYVDTHVLVVWLIIPPTDHKTTFFSHKPIDGYCALVCLHRRSWARSRPCNQSVNKEFLGWLEDGSPPRVCWCHCWWLR